MLPTNKKYVTNKCTYDQDIRFTKACLLAFLNYMASTFIFDFYPFLRILIDKAHVRFHQTTVI